MRGLMLTLTVAAVLCAQPALTFPPPKVNAPDEATLSAIKEKTAALREALKGKHDPDLLIYLKAAEYIVRHNEFYGDQAKWTLGVLDDGLKLARDGKPADIAGTTQVCAYRSEIDGSIQPYAITLPPDYGKEGKKPWPMHVVLHGRDANLTEVAFLHRNRNRKAAKDLDHVVLDVYGRGNNAYRWAGERDVFETIEDWPSLKCRAPSSQIDRDRFVLRGFSMGGAGTWHLGLHHPGKWRVIGPGAGFTTTKGYAGKLNLTPTQEKTLHIYDAVDYAENAFNVPVIAYSGGDDPQKKAADNIEAALDKLGMKMTHLVSPKTGHTTPPAYQKLLAAEYAKRAAGNRPEPDKVVFVTYTLKYPSCHWVHIQHLDEHYARTRVEAERSPAGFTVSTQNVRHLSLTFDGPIEKTALKVTVDGQTLEDVKVQGIGGTRFVYLQKKAGKWRSSVVVEHAGPEKAVTLTGPIDDAFTQPFLCVRGTGTAWNPAVAAYADADLARFQREWSKYLRGDLRVKDDKDVTEDDIQNKALVLFGDPGSNSLLAKALPKLPLKWTKKEVTWQGKAYDAATHVPAFIHPNPLNPSRYVVVNSGHTFHEDAFQGTNALLYPRLGDHALLRLTDAKKPLATDVVASGLFDEFWKFRREAD